MLRGTPHLTIASAADDVAMRALIRAAVVDGVPSYIRAPSTFAAPVYDVPPSFERGKLHEVGSGGDILLVGTGLGTSLCAQARSILADNGVEVLLLDAAWLKPFDAADLCRRAATARAIVTVEEHNETAGLASLVAEALGRGGISCPLETIGLPDGDLAVAVPNLLFERYGLTVGAIVAKITALANSTSARRD